MSGYLETAVVLTPVGWKGARGSLARLQDALVSRFELPESLDGSVYALHPGDPDAIDLGRIDSQPLPVDTLAQAHDVAKSFVARSTVLIGEVCDHIEIYAVCPPSDASRLTVIVRLASSFLESVYQRDEYDADQAQQLRGFVVSVATSAGADGFELEPWVPSELVGPIRSADQTSQRMLKPTLDELRKHPKYVMGMPDTAVSRAEVAAVWGDDRVHRVTTGHVVVDLLGPREDNAS
jgi:hypothetical protein